MTVLSDRQQLSYIAGQAADARLNVELETEGMTLNIGPQHPATHGTLRIICRLDGEQVVWAEPSAGYMHRGYEKLTEVRTFPQVTALVNRIDWLGSFANEVPFILAAEKLMQIEAPPRAQVIRTILFELSRIANVSLFLGDLGVQMGAITPVFLAFRDREYVLNLIEGATGGPRDAVPFDFGALRRRFKQVHPAGAWMVNNGYDRAMAMDVVARGAADLVAFGKAFIANPDLVRRLREDAPLNVPQRETFYGGGAAGYTDYPALDAVTVA